MNETKSAFASVSILGGAATTILFLIAGALGFHLDKAQTLGFIDALKEVWPMLVGAGSAVAVIWSRLKHVDFTKANIPGIVAALLALLAAFGIDVHDVQHLTGISDDLTARLPGIIASAVSLYGVLRAKKEVVITRATPLPLLLAFTLPLSSCAQWQKLAPETQARLESAAIAAGAAAATTAAESLANGKSTKEAAAAAGIAAVKAGVSTINGGTH